MWYKSDHFFLFTKKRMTEQVRKDDAMKTDACLKKTADDGQPATKIFLR